MGKRGPKPGHGGRPMLNVDFEVAFRAASIGCTDNELAALVGMSRRGFDLRLSKDESLAEQIEQARDRGRVTLRRMQWQRAQAGSDHMLVWLGKNFLNQTDKREMTGANGGPMEMIVTGVRRAPEIDGEAEEMPPPDIGTGVQRAIEAGDGDD